MSFPSHPTVRPVPQADTSYMPAKRWLVQHRAMGLTLLLALGLLPFFALSFYNSPFWDDFGMALMVRQYGLWPAQKVFYLTWGGRYGTALVQTLSNPLTYGWVGGMHFTPLVLLGSTLLVLHLNLRELSGRRLSSGTAGRGAALLLLLSLAWMPTIYPLFYWFTAGTGYMLGIILMLLIPAAGLRALRAGTDWGRRGWYGVAQASTVLAVGLNEIALLLLAWLLLVLLACSWWAGRGRAAACWGGLLVSAVVGGTVAVLAPGNWVRMYGPSGASQPHASLNVSNVLRYAAEFFTGFLAQPLHIMALLLLALLLGPLLVRTRHWRPVGFRLPLAGGVAVLLVGLGSSFVFHALVTQNPPPGRTLSFMWLWLFLGWVGVLWAAVPRRVAPLLVRTLARLQRLAAGVTFVLLLLGVERSAWTEWLRNAPTWRAQNDARFCRMQEAVRLGQRVVVVPPFEGIVPRHISILGENLFFHPGNSIQHHNNDVTARWFGLDSVNLSAPSLQGRVGEGL
ncbi:DUF6056 family protein [Hymenobacter rubidus]|uniref:DUF6056 family protein n=1 Tax=Hymenobacter rubidus TaxID=1441626 RepID=UPI00191D42E3|nr:DUF6056 family protein [Hymenobacter rubidus]